MDTNGSEFNEEVNLFRSPPNFLQAENHCKAQIIHKEVIRNSKRCPCCNLYIETIRYSLSTDINIFMAHGTGYKYFLMIQIQYILLTINFIVAGIYNLIQNQKGYQCLNNETCKKTLINYLSILNRMDSDYFQDNILDILYLVSIVIQLAFLRYISYSEYDYYNLDHEIDGEQAIQCCSMQILKISSEFNKKQIMNYFANHQSEEEVVVNFNIIDCCLMYDEDHLENQLKLKIKEILAQNNDMFISIIIFSTLKNVIQRTVDQIFILQNRELFLKFSGRVFITLASEKEAINFKKTFENEFKVIQSTRPSDVKWKTNMQMVNLILQFVKIFIGAFLFIPLVYIQQAKNEYVITNSGKTGNQVYINTLLSLSIAIIVFIIRKISIYLLLNYHYKLQERLSNKTLNYVLQHLELYSNFIYYVVAPTYSISQQDENGKKSKIWSAGGFSEDIINNVLINLLLSILFSIIDLDYAWQLIQITYYKYFNTNSTLTQFEANQKVQKTINFNIKNNQTTNLILICFYYGYIFPLCYPITLIGLLIIYWVDKYQLINYGVGEDLKLEFHAFKLLISYSIMLQLASTQIIFTLLQVVQYTRPQLYIAICISLLLIPLFYLSSWVFKKQAQQDQTNVALMKSLEYNDLYSKYNPLIDETLWLNQDYEEEEQQFVEGLHLHKFSRQAKFYDALKVKLLRELEKEFQQNSVSTARIQPLQVETI